MFTGLVTGVGTVQRIGDIDAGRELTIAPNGAFDSPLVLGESISVNGVCLTVRTIESDGAFTVAAVSTTLERTTAGDWTKGTSVNLERAMLATDRFGGHIVQGHVDCVATVRNTGKQESALLVDIEIPAELEELVVLHGSITVDGVSLTVNALPSQHTVQLSLIEFTLNHTTLGKLVSGSRVNVEADVLAKYVQRQLRVREHSYGTAIT